MSDDEVVRSVGEVAKTALESTPIYEDALQPEMQELGRGFKTVCATVNVALSPLAMLVWGYDQIKVFLETQVAAKLIGTPPEDIATPDPTVACPAILALRYCT